MKIKNVIPLAVAVAFFAALNVKAYFDPSVGRFASRDPILEVSFQNAFYPQNPNFADNAQDGNEYLFVADNPIDEYDVLGLCIAVKSGPPQFNQGWWGTFQHHPIIKHTKHPATIATFTLACPSSAPYLQSWGLTTSYQVPPSSPDHPFPSDFQTAPNSPSGGPGTYTIGIVWPSWPILFYPPILYGPYGDPNSQFVYVLGCCSCSKSTSTRNDPPLPPQHRPPGSGN